MHVDGWLCEIKDVQIRDGLHVLGQAPDGDDLVNLVLAILRSNQVFGGQVNGVPGLRVGARPRTRGHRHRAPTSTRPRRRPRALVEAAGRRRLAVRTPVDGVIMDRARDAGPGGVRVAAVRLHRGGAAAAADHRRDRRGAARPGRRLHPGRSVRISPARLGQRAADRAQLLLRRPQGDPVPAGLPDRAGDGRLAAPAVSRRHRRLPEVGRPVGLGHLGHADRRRRHRRGARAARRAAGLGRDVPSGGRPRGGPAGRAGPAPDRRHRADLRLLPGRLPARGRDARRRRPAGGRAGRAGRRQLRPGPRPRRPGRAR